MQVPLATSGDTEKFEGEVGIWVPPEGKIQVRQGGAINGKLTALNEEGAEKKLHRGKQERISRVSYGADGLQCPWHFAFGQPKWDLWEGTVPSIMPPDQLITPSLPQSFGRPVGEPLK